MSYIVEIINNSGAKVAQLSESECSCSIVRTINKEWSITLAYNVPPTGQSKLEHFSLWGVKARVTNTSDPTDYQTFSLNQPEYKRGGDGSVVVLCVGEHISIATMRNEIINTEIDFQQATISNILSRVLGYSSYDVGTASTDTRVSLKVSYESVLSAISKIIDLTGYEYTINESTGLLSISSQIGSNNYVRIKSGRNTISVSRKIINSNVANKVYGVGGGSPPVTIAGARHEVYSVVGQVVTIKNNSVVSDNDTWNGYYAYVATGNLAGQNYQITDCSHGLIRDTITLFGSITNLESGDMIVICSAANTPVDYINSLQSQSLYGVIKGVYKNQQYGSITNNVKSSDFDDTYTNGLCNNWSIVGSTTVYENTSQLYIKYGEKSQRLINTGTNNGITQEVSVVSGSYYTVFANVYIVSGVAALICTIDSTSYYVSNESGVTGWQTLKFEGVYANNVSTVDVSFRSFDAAEYFIDSVAVIESVLNENGTIDDRKYIKNCEQTDLWAETFNYLQANKYPKVEYTANFVDLYKLDPINYCFDSVNIGDTVLISDEKIGISNIPARITEVRYSPFRPELTEHKISTVV